MKDGFEYAKSLLELIPKFSCERLRNQVKTRVEQSPKKIRTLKFPCVNRNKFPAIVYWEEHLEISLATTVKKTKNMLMPKIGLLEGSSLQLYFVGRKLNDEEVLSEVGIAHPDRVYVLMDYEKAKVDKGRIQEELKEWKEKSELIGKAVAETPILLQHFARILALCVDKIIKGDSNREEELSWRAATALSSFIGLLPEKERDVARKTLFELIELADRLSTAKESIATLQWHFLILNILCWAGYRLSFVLTDDEGKITDEGRKLMEYLAYILRNSERPDLKSEAAWALGWIGVTSPNVSKTKIITLLESLKSDDTVLESVAMAFLRVSASTANSGLVQEASRYLINASERVLGNKSFSNYLKIQDNFRYAAAFYDRAVGYQEISDGLTFLKDYEENFRNETVSTILDDYQKSERKANKLIFYHMLPTLTLMTSVLIGVLLPVEIFPVWTKNLGHIFVLAPLFVVLISFLHYAREEKTLKSKFSFLPILFILVANGLLIYLTNSDGNDSVFSYFSFLLTTIVVVTYWYMAKGAVFCKSTIFRVVSNCNIGLFAAMPALLFLLKISPNLTHDWFQVLKSIQPLARQLISIAPAHIFFIYFISSLFKRGIAMSIFPFSSVSSLVVSPRPIYTVGRFEQLGGAVRLQTPKLATVTQFIDDKTLPRGLSEIKFTELIKSDKFSFIFLFLSPFLLSLFVAWSILKSDLFTMAYSFLLTSLIIFLVVSRLLTTKFSDLERIESVCLSLVFLMPLSLIQFFYLFTESSNLILANQNQMTPFFMLIIVITACLIYIYTVVHIPGSIAIKSLKNRKEAPIDLEISFIERRVIEQSEKEQIPKNIELILDLLKRKKSEIELINDYPFSTFFNTITSGILGFIISTLLQIIRL